MTATFETIQETTAAAGEAGLTSACPVNSHNEWDPLEEVMVGRLENAVIPCNHPVVTSNVPGMTGKMFGLFAGIKYPGFMIKPAQDELDQFIEILTGFGIKVVRPDAVNQRKKITTPEFSCRQFCNTCPRDCMLVIGDEIIETPMAWPCRYFETHSYRKLLKDYFRRGARWTSAPKPELADELFEDDYKIPGDDDPMRYVINEWEPVFDAADFVRCGRDLFVTKSNVTNDMGIDWLQRHLGSGYKIHRVESLCKQPMHIDTTFLPLAPGKLLVNPDYVDVNNLPPILKNWDVLVAPEPDPITDDKILALTSMCGKWLNMNVLMLDEKRVVVEKHHTGMIRQLEKWGFEPVALPVPALRAVRRGVPLRDARHPAAGDAAVVLRLRCVFVAATPASPCRRCCDWQSPFTSD